MKHLVFSHEYSLVPSAALHDLGRKLETEIAAMREVVQQGGYENERASLNLVDDEQVLHDAQAMAKRIGEVDCLIVVGIGGSNLGTLAVHEAINRKLYNGFHAPSVFFSDTVDANAMYDLIQIVERFLTAKKKVLINVVSKSGSTTETIANFEVLFEVLKNHIERPEKQVVVTTDKGSKLWELAQRNEFHVLTVPKLVGGRYSVFSSVGLFPLALLNVDIHSLLKGAQHMRTLCLDVKVEHNPAALTAAIMYHHATHARNIVEQFFFANDLESVGKWYRQLVAESIGKEWNRSRTKRVLNGVTPVTSIGSTDLHSVAQLDIGGPQDKFTTFITLDKVHKVNVPHYNEYDALVPHIQGKDLHQIMDAIVKGVHATYEKQSRPYVHIALPDDSPYSIGQLLQFYMMQAMYLGYLMDVNPFDQPNVEEYKVVTKTILSKQ
jgi:glucose-6-phosphate isomerase